MAWNKLQDILVEVLTQLGVCLCGRCPIFWPGAPKMAQIRPNSYFEHSVGPKRLEWHGTSYRTSWLRFWHCWECVCVGFVPNFGPGAAKTGQNGPKMTRSQSLAILSIFGRYRAVLDAPGSKLWTGDTPTLSTGSKPQPRHLYSNCIDYI